MIRVSDSFITEAVCNRSRVWEAKDGGGVGGGGGGSLPRQTYKKEARVSFGRDTGILPVNTGDAGRATPGWSQQLCALVAHWTSELWYVCVEGGGGGVCFVSSHA